MSGGQEVAAFFLAPFIWTADELLDPERVDALLAEQGLTRAQTTDRDGWLTLAVCEGFCEALNREIDDPTFFDRCGRAALSAKAMGMMRPLFRGVGNPAFGYQQAARGLSRFNKVGTMEIQDEHPGYLKLTYQPAPGAPRESSPLICVTRRSQLAAFPTLFGLPPATIDHLTCLHEGGECCTYEIHYQPGGERRLGVGVSMMLAVLSGGAALLADCTVGLSALLGVVSGALLYQTLRLGGLQRRLDSRVEELAESHDALTQYAHTNERRYQELEEAKAAVEQRVAQRTESLSRTRDQLSEMLERVHRLSESRQRFVADVSHELFTPLQILFSALDELEGQPPQIRQRITRQLSRLQALIDRLLEGARAESGLTPLQVVPTDLVALLTDTVIDMSARARLGGVVLDAELPDAPVVFPVDPTWIASAVTNLISNAVRVCPAGSLVSVCLAETAGGVLIEVEDDGPGISDEVRVSLFERSVQGSVPGRSGLGLNIVAGAVRMHGGTVGVESTLGRGCRFRIQLPRRSERPPAPHSETAPTPEPVECTAPPEAPLALVVDDEPDIRHLLCRLLAPRFRIISAADGEEALALAQAHGPELVVTDVSMPRLGGIALTRQLRAAPLGKAPVVLVLTAHHDHEKVLAAFEAGADDFLSKPFHGPELLARAGVHLRNRALLRQIAHTERLAAIGTMAASLAHQIRNPLNVIRTGTTAISTSAPDDLMEVAAVVDASVERIDRSITELLMLSRQDQGQPQPQSMTDALHSVVGMVALTLPKGISFQVDIGTGPPVLAHPGVLGHIWLNLLDNAVRAVGEAGAITLQASADETGWRVCISDSGDGIAPELAERVFEPFYTTRAAGEGTGLGLAIVGNIVRVCGGEIVVRPGSLGGAMFVVQLPGVSEFRLSEPALEE